MSSTSNLQTQRKIVEQLRQEAHIHRKPVSECIRDLIMFTQENEDKDVLVSGFSSKRDNPFQEKGSCTLV